MDTVFRAVVQLTITTKVMAFNFEGFMNTLPVPADLRAMVIDIHKQQQKFSMPDKNAVSLMDFKTTTPFIASNDNEIMTELNKPVIPSRRLLKSLVTLNPGPSYELTTAKAPNKPLTLPPPFHQLPRMPLQMPMQMAMAMPIFARVPMILPMRAYFETVQHDHPPLHKIKRMIEEDEKRWKEEKGSDSDISVEVAYSDESSDRSKDTDTDSDVSEDNDVGSDDCDDSL